MKVSEEAALLKRLAKAIRSFETKKLLSFFTMPSQMLYWLILVELEVVGTPRVLAALDFLVVIIESFPSDVLVLACYQLMSCV